MLLVADSLTGQDAVNTATRLRRAACGITGIVLTRVDGDGRGGAALSMRAVTGKPIKLLGTGEKVDALEDFDPGRVAGRILGMGDIVALVEKAAQTIDAEKAAKMAAKLQKGAFDLDDLREQLLQMEKIGGIGGVLGMLPGVAKMKDQIAASGMNDAIFSRQLAIINSMTPQERRNPDLLKATPQAAHRQRLRHQGRGGQPPAEAAPQMADMMKAMGGAASAARWPASAGRSASAAACPSRRPR